MCHLKTYPEKKRAMKQNYYNGFKYIIVRKRLPDNNNTGFGLIIEKQFTILEEF